MKKYFIVIALLAIVSCGVPGITSAQTSTKDQQIMVLLQLLQQLQAQLAALQHIPTAVAPITVPYTGVTINYVNTFATEWSGQGFFDGEKIFVVEVDIKNTSNQPQVISASSFVVKNADSIPFLPIRLSAIGNQPRVPANVGISGLGTNRPEIIATTLGAGQSTKGALVFYVAEKPTGAYTIEYNGVATKLKNF